MNDLQREVKDKIQQLQESTKDKHCDGCYYLEVTSPFRGATAANIDRWRDEYKCKCNYFNHMWLNGGETNTSRLIECLVCDVKESVAND